jgi:epoxyqueuosine reductase
MNCEEPKIERSFEGRHSLELALGKRGADIIRFADVSSLSEQVNRGFNKAILVGILLSRKYIIHLFERVSTDFDEFNEKEHWADALAEWTAEYLQKRGYHAYAQSEANIGRNGYFDVQTKTSVLPHKTIALLAGLGWIGKNNLLITKDYGCAFCMCTVLTDAPMEVEKAPLTSPQCGECDICIQVCPVHAISGNTWTMDRNRDGLVDVYRCQACLKCLSHCPWTVRYGKGDPSGK